MARRADRCPSLVAPSPVAPGSPRPPPVRPPPARVWAVQVACFISTARSSTRLATPGWLRYQALAVSRLPPPPPKHPPSAVLQASRQVPRLPSPPSLPVRAKPKERSPGKKKKIFVKNRSRPPHPCQGYAHCTVSRHILLLQRSLFMIRVLSGASSSWTKAT